MRRLAAPLAAAFLLPALPAAAQDDAAAVAPADGPAWSAATAATFFADEGRTVLLDEAEIRARWAELDPAAQEEVLRDCAAISLDAEDVEGAAAGGVLDAGPPADPDADGPVAKATAAACALAETF